MTFTSASGLTYGPFVEGSVSEPRMVKKLDLLESNHGCGLNAAG
jgi:hypothetical protein